MKKQIKINWAILFIIVSFIACTKILKPNNANREMIPILCQKWIITSSDASLKTGIFPAETYSTVEFNKDGSAIFYILDSTKGNWKYNIKTKILTITLNNNVEEWKIIELINDRIILEKSYMGKLQTTVLSKID